MNESRRFFLKSLMGTSVAYCFLSSVPVIGESVSTLMSSDGMTALITPSWISKEVALGWMNSLQSAKHIDRAYA